MCHMEMAFLGDWVMFCQCSLLELATPLSRFVAVPMPGPTMHEPTIALLPISSLDESSTQICKEKNISVSFVPKNATRGRARARET